MQDPQTLASEQEVYIPVLRPQVACRFSSRPLGFAVRQEQFVACQAPVFVARNPSSDAEQRGVKDGHILATLNGKDVTGMSEEVLIRLLATAPLPLTLEFASPTW